MVLPKFVYKSKIIAFVERHDDNNYCRNERFLSEKSTSDQISPIINKRFLLLSPETES